MCLSDQTIIPAVLFTLALEEGRLSSSYEPALPSTRCPGVKRLAVSSGPANQWDQYGFFPPRPEALESPPRRE